MTSLGASAAAKFLRKAAHYGTAATITLGAADYATDGTVSGTQASAAANVFGPIDESRRYQQSGTDTRVTATFYVPASGLGITPKTGTTVAFDGGKSWQAHAVFTAQFQGVDISHRLDCSEVPSG